MVDIYHDKLPDAGHLSYSLLTAGIAIFTLQLRTAIQALFVGRIYRFEFL
jgi:hypothetical protein